MASILLLAYILTASRATQTQLDFINVFSADPELLYIDDMLVYCYMLVFELADRNIFSLYLKYKLRVNKPL